jgi:hypothetical protein
MKIINAERNGFTRVGGTLVAVGYVALTGVFAVEMIVYGSQQGAKSETYAVDGSRSIPIEAQPTPTSAGELGSAPVIVPTTPTTKSPTPRTTRTTSAPRSTPTRTHVTNAPKERTAAVPAESLTLDPGTCGDWSPKKPQPLVVAGSTARVIVDTRLKDGCEPPFYSGANVYAKPSTTSEEVDLGTSFTTAGSIALNGSVLTVEDYTHGQNQSVKTADGTVSSDIWLKVAFSNGEVGNVSAVDVGFPTPAMLDKYTS